MNEKIQTYSGPNVFIFEGIDFCGKTTMSKYFADKLKAEFGEENVYWFRSPGGSPKAEEHRGYTRAADLSVEEQAEAYLQCFQHTMSYLEKLREENENIIFVVDRWLPSYQIYQADELNKHPDTRTLVSHCLLRFRAKMVDKFDFRSIKKPVMFSMYLSSDEYTKRKGLVKRRADEPVDRFESFELQKQLDILNKYQRMRFNPHYQERYDLQTVNANATEEVVKTYFDNLFNQIVLSQESQPCKNT